LFLIAFASPPVLERIETLERFPLNAGHCR
jgi:hypothetical protein